MERCLVTLMIVFQHTAARRRLLPTELDGLLLPARFNTQPPEGGCAP